MRSDPGTTATSCPALYYGLRLFIGVGHEIKLRRLLPNLRGGEPAEPRHDLGVSRKGENFPDAMDVLGRKQHVISFEREPNCIRSEARCWRSYRPGIFMR